MNRRPSLLRIAFTDYAAFLAFMLPIGLWGTLLLHAVLGQKGDPSIGILLIIPLTFLAWPYAIWRSRDIQTAIEHGVECPAILSNVSFFRDRGRVDYIYTYQGQKYSSGSAVMKNGRTQALSVGQQIVVVVDPNNPKRAFIRDLYQ